jgi:DNA invertase Pin-like site-specific DNA recombinase
VKTLDAQKAAFARFCADYGQELAGEPFVEKRTGADDDRPILGAAMAKARKLKGAVVVAKLDRLSRDVDYISGLMKHQVPCIVTELGTEWCESLCGGSRPFRRQERGEEYWQFRHSGAG